MGTAAAHSFRFTVLSGRKMKHEYRKGAEARKNFEKAASARTPGIAWAPRLSFSRCFPVNPHPPNKAPSIPT